MANKIDSVVESMIINLFDKMKGVNEADLLNNSYEQEIQGLGLNLKKKTSEYKKKQVELEKLDTYLLCSIEGKGAFTPTQLSRRMEKLESEIKELAIEVKKIEEELASTNDIVGKINSEYNRLIYWSSIFENAPIETKKWWSHIR